MALGLALVWGVLNIVNLAHGALIMLGAYVCYYLFTGLNLDPFAALPLTMLHAVCLRLPVAALRAQSGDPGADVQYAADHLRDRRRADLSGADLFQRRFPHHQPDLRRQQFRAVRRHRARRPRARVCGGAGADVPVVALSLRARASAGRFAPPRRIWWRRGSTASSRAAFTR